MVVQLYVRVVADIAKQAKFIDAGPEASWLWLASLGHCRISLTDGVIKAAVATTLVPGKTPSWHRKQIAVLVDVALWDRYGERDFFLHDYFTMNPTKAEVQAKRSDWAERKRIERESQPLSNADREQVSNVDIGMSQLDTGRVSLTRDARAPQSRAASDSVSDSAFGSEALPEESARETDALAVNRGGRYTPKNPMQPAWGHRRRSQPLVVNHRSCDVATAAACERGFCVPVFYPRDRWRPQIDPEQRDLAGTDAHIRQVVVYGLERLPSGGAIGGTTPEKFWGAVWEEFHAQNAPAAVGTSSRAGGSKTGDSMAAARAYLEQRATALASGDE
jgi:hypothetical protein